MSRIRSRCSSTDRSRSNSLRRSSPTVLSSGSIRSFSVFARARRSASSGTAWRAVRDLAQPLADHQVAGHEVGRHLVAAAQHRPGRLADLGQPGQRPAAQRGQRLGQPDRLDDVRRGDRQVAAAQHPGHLDQPPGHHVVRGGEQVVVPARRGHPRAVAGRRRQPGVGPRHPGQRGLALGRAAQQRGVGRGGRELARQRRGVPGAADHGDHPVGLPERRRAAPGACAASRRSSCCCRFRGAAGGRARSSAMASVSAANGGCPSMPRLDDVVPPALRVVVPGRAGQQAMGPPAAPRPLGRAGCSVRALVRSLRPARRCRCSGRSVFVVLGVGFFVVAVGQDHGRGQVAEAHRHLVLGGPAQRLPFRREHRERPERGDPRCPGHVGQQRHRRAHARVRGQRQQRVGVGRPLDQHDVRADPVQLGHHRPGRARPVVPDAQHRDPVRARPRPGRGDSGWRQPARRQPAGDATGSRRPLAE